MFLKKLSVTLLLFVGTVLIANANEDDLEYRKYLIFHASIGPKLFVSFVGGTVDGGDVRKKHIFI